MIVADPLEFRFGCVAVIGIHAPLLDVREKRSETVKLARRHGVELVIVAFGTAQGQTEPDRGDIANAIGEILGLILLRLGAAFLGCLQEPIVTGGDALLVGRIGRQIARDR